MMRKEFLLLLIGVVTALGHAGDIEAGRATAGTCVACHGENGAQPIAYYPIIAGQHENYLLHSLRAYRDGSRNDVIMAQQVAELSDIDMQNLAAYFATQASPLK